MPKQAKERLDVLLVDRALAPSRTKAQAMIMAGEVYVAGQLSDKPGIRFAVDAEITVRSRPPYISRGGEKLAHALAQFSYDVKGLVCADVGASTGGFTDCLLQNGARCVYAIDVGYGQLAHQLRMDERVVVMERTNARYVASLPELMNLIVIDASFISLRLLLPVVRSWLVKDGDVIALIKPQFEAGRRDVGKGGVVRSTEIHNRVLFDTLSFAYTETQLSTLGLVRSPIQGPAGNTEFLAWFSSAGFSVAPAIEEMIASVLGE